jgi:Zinc carboxypeptidase
MSRGELNELAELHRILEAGAAHLDVRTLCEVETGGRRFPVYAACLGSKSPDAPAVGFFGGVHGLERIGTQVLLAYLSTLVARLAWDELLHDQLSRVRLVFVPMVNPGGMWRHTRANPNGVDIMRNAPVDAAERVPFLLGGQRISSSLPWYRGVEHAPMEIESRAVCDLVEQELLARPFSVALDCHSGFGLRDRIWFPHAHTRSPFPELAEIHALVNLFDGAYPNHNYVFEPQCRQYLAHGDLWDHLYLRPRTAPGRVFLPLTLEMGSWLWIKKSPRQLFSRQGIFNPLPAHRQQRVLRGHLVWFEFLCRSAFAWQKWLPRGADRAEHERAGLDSWFRASA